MKIILVFTLMFISITFSIGQSFSVNYTTEDGIDQIEINIDTNWSSDGIFVEKVFASSASPIPIDQNSLVLIGFETLSDSILQLDYTNFNYYWIPFDPALPFYSINNSISQDVSEGSLYLGSNFGEEAHDGDFIYWCTCGGHTSEATEPGGDCVSSMTTSSERVIIACVGGCEDECIGEAAFRHRFDGGGGILIQVNEDKDVLVHNFGTKP